MVAALTFTVIFWSFAATVALIPVVLIWRDLFKTAPTQKEPTK